MSDNKDTGAVSKRQPSIIELFLPRLTGNDFIQFVNESFLGEQEPVCIWLRHTVEEKKLQECKLVLFMNMLKKMPSLNIEEMAKSPSMIAIHDDLPILKIMVNTANVNYLSDIKEYIDLTFGSDVMPFVLSEWLRNDIALCRLRKAEPEAADQEYNGVPYYHLN